MKLVIRHNEITNTPRVNDWRRYGVFSIHSDKSQPIFKTMMLIQDMAAKPNTESFGRQH